MNPYIGLKQDDLKEMSRVNLGLAEAIGSVLTGAASALVRLPAEFWNIFQGEASEDLRKKYDPEGEVLKKKSEKMIDFTYAPKTKHGKATVEVLSGLGEIADKFYRGASGFIPSTLDWVPGQWPKTALAADQGVYTLLNMVNPYRGVKRVPEVVKEGFGTIAAYPSITRRDAAGEDPSLLNQSWYRGGRQVQLAKMVGETLYSMGANFLNPKDAWLSETLGLSRTTSKELARLEGVMAQSRDAMKKETNKKSEAYKEASRLGEAAFNEYINEAAKVIITGRKYSPDNPRINDKMDLVQFDADTFKSRLNAMEENLVGSIFPTSATAKYAEVMDNPQIIAEVLKSTLPNEMLLHVLPRIEHFTRGSPSTHWVTKPLMPVSGGVRAASLGKKSLSGNVNPIHHVKDAWVRAVRDDVPISRESILERVPEEHREFIGKNLIDKDGFISVSSQSLTPDRLLASMEHVWVFDKKTGDGAQFNVDHYKLGASSLLSKIVDVGSKYSTVVVDINKANVFPEKSLWGSKTIRKFSNKFKVKPVMKYMKELDPETYDLKKSVLEGVGPKIRSKPTGDYIFDRILGSYGYQALPLGRQSLREEEGLLSENRKTRNIY